ncbi:MAG: membrane dipeptidase [Verrucomicrobia bacterium]|nr:membrane dipeptidase [Verrucomicrobiota bacterium]
MATNSFILDAHLDLSMNALEWNRDLARPIEEIRAREKGQTDKKDRGQNTVCFPEMRRGRIGICVATQIARYVKPSNHRSGWHSPAQAWAQTQGQLAWYRAMEERGELVQITNTSALETMVQLWTNRPPENAPIGYVLSLEGADSMVTLKHLERAHAYGLRALGPAHYGPGTYAPGTEADGPLSPQGRELVKEMDRLKLIMDCTHLADEAFWEATKIFQGPIWASHQNCRALVPDQRQFSDEQLKLLISRGGVIGSALDAWMMVPGWKKYTSRPEDVGVKLDHMVNHIDHVCQLAGNARHAGIGTDLDGGFGREQSPMDLNTIADLQKLPDLLAKRGYSTEDIQLVLHGNFLRFLRQHLPK